MSPGSHCWGSVCSLINNYKKERKVFSQKEGQMVNSTAAAVVEVDGGGQFIIAEEGC